MLIQRHASSRAFSTADTFPSEGAAIDACYVFGRRIIDGRVPHFSVDDLL